MQVHAKQLLHQHVLLERKFKYPNVQATGMNNIVSATHTGDQLRESASEKKEEETEERR